MYLCCIFIINRAYHQRRLRKKYGSKSLFNNRKKIRISKKKCSPKNITTNAKPIPLNVNIQGNYSSNKVYCWEDQERMKTMISFYQEHNYHHKYLDCDNRLSIAKEKIVSIVARELKLDRSHYETVKNTINQTIECLENNEVYVPMRKPYEVESRQKISVNSFDMHLLAKFKTQSSYRIAANVYNIAFRMNNGLNPLGYKSILHFRHQTVR